ncbi:MAG: MATE family efflux transporter [Eubacteriales bacterium]|nr:MATE family efflux transporter [Eubacteriales bacterium]MDD4475466.1 MATE family efflux transporter [Eubacteriales bacterium]
MTRDLTKGNITKTLLLYSLPMMGSVIFQQMYNIADSVIVGKLIGEDALATVTASIPVTMLLVAVATGFSIGSSVIISQQFGAKDMTAMKTSANTALIYAAGVSVLLSAIAMLLCNPLLKLMNTPQSIFNDSAAFLYINILGFVFLMVYNTCTGIFTALGNSKLPLYFLIGSSTLNVVLDLIFVSIFNMGIRGVAWTTVIAQGLAMVLSLTVLLKKLKEIETTQKPSLFSKTAVKKLNKIALPSILQQSFIAIGNLFVQGEINGYGQAVIAGYGSAVKLNTFCIMSINTLASGISSFTAQNYGAKRYDRIEKGYKTGILIVSAVVTPFIILYLLFGSQLVGIFMKEESVQALSVGVNFLRIVSPFYYIVAVKIISDSLLRGSGNMRSFVIATFADLLMRVIFLYILSFVFKSADWLWASWPIGWGVSMVISLVYALRQIKYMKTQTDCKSNQMC